MNRTFADGRVWMAEGAKLFGQAIAGLSEAQYDQPTLLPGWTRKHLVAHVAGNAEALLNLVHWAATGEITPMYASTTERAAGIERGAQIPGSALTAWMVESQTNLLDGMTRLTERQWQAEIKTAQGRTLPATELPWLRSREVLVHAVDLHLGVTFAHLPSAFLKALVTDISAKRQFDVRSLPQGPLPEVAAWLAGRPHMLAGAPEIEAWL